MRAIARRLYRLEQRFWGSAVEDQQTLRLRARLEAARRRCGLPAASAERVAELRGIGVVEILNSARAPFKQNLPKRP